MLDQYNYHKNYLSDCVMYIFNIIVSFPMLNNLCCMNYVLDYYIRDFVMYNTEFSAQISNDCGCFVEFMYCTEYINLVKETFQTEEDAYHYLAILLQVRRLSNLYKLNTSNINEVLNYDNLVKAVNEY